MKTVKNLLTVAFALVFLLSCEMDEINCVRVDGQIETQKRTLDSFNSIFFGDVGNLHISQGNEQKFIIKGQKVILDKLKTEVKNDQLIISLDECFNGDAYSLDIYITATKLNEIEMAGVGSVKSETKIISSNFNLILNGVAESHTLEIEADSLTTYLLGTGNLNLSGVTCAHSILFSGTGDINSGLLQTAKTYITSNGAGDIYVNVSSHLDVTLNTTGNVYYKGDPTISKQENGEGKVINDN